MKKVYEEPVVLIAEIEDVITDELDPVVSGGSDGVL